MTSNGWRKKLGTQSNFLFRVYNLQSSADGSVYFVLPKQKRTQTSSIDGL